MSKLSETSLEKIKARCNQLAGNCNYGCEYKRICSFNGVTPGSMKRPRYWVLTDPPKFSDKQRALFEALSKNGVCSVTLTNGSGYVMYDDAGGEIKLHDILKFENSQTQYLDEVLAEGVSNE